MKLSRLLFLASLALAALAALEHALERRSESARRAGVRVERLVDPAQKEGVTVAAVTLGIPGRPELVYARSRGEWRCMSAFGAPVAIGQLQGLLASFLEARGVVRARSNAAAATYGLAETATLVRFHGPKILTAEDRDVLFAFEVGASVAGGALGRAFVRALDSGAILEIDHDPTRFLAWPEGQAFPPLLDERLLAGAWPRGVQGFERIFVDFESGASLELARRPAPDAGAEGGLGEWVARDGTREVVALPYRLAGFLNFLARATFTGLADPRDAAGLGHDPPFARVTIVPTGAEPLELTVGNAIDAEGTVFVANGASGALVQTSAESARLLAPTLTMMVDTNIPNPWEVWLSR
ncbi:MAG: hypothetical protein E2O39_13475 [Planctomycetota bacterium]|nr:MAG: hypothetical protein E2O39_13475 [Planctomycetota bacterium]